MWQRWSGGFRPPSLVALATGDLPLPDGRDSGLALDPLGGGTTSAVAVDPPPGFSMVAVGLGVDVALGAVETIADVVTLST